MDFSPDPSIPASSPQSQTKAQSNNGHEPYKEKPAPKSKRARPTISCLECRRKKLKCDRVQPCQQCTKSGKEALCAFANPPVPPKSHEILHHRPAEISNKRTKFQGRSSSIEISSNPNKVAWPLTPGHVWNRNLQYEEESCGGREEEHDSDCPWLIDTNGAEQQDKIPSNKPTGEKKCLGKIYIKNGRSKFLGIGDRMVILDHVNVFLLRDHKKPILLILAVSNG